MNTLDYILNKYNLHTEYIEIPNVGRDDLATLFKELGFKEGAEIGVANGEYSKILMEAGPFTLHGVDPYVSYEGYHDYKLRSTFEKMKNQALKYLSNYPTYHFVEKFSLEAVKDFQDNSLDFVYIDGNHSGPAVKEDMEAWTEKVRYGGIVAGHDFTSRWPSLKKEVQEYARKNGHQLFILGMEAKDVGLKRDPSRSWFFVKK